MCTCEVVHGPDLDIDEVASLYRASTLAERRPVDDAERFADMVRNANLVIVARIHGRLVGIARSITDGAYATYLSDIAVDVEFQHRGIGRDLIAKTREAAPRAKIVLLSAPAAAGYYPHIGFSAHNSAWVMDALDP
jgi:ribosomal protein S18 acetylase RimI-like enzyme